jgi:signal transduction histidine kinase
LRTVSDPTRFSSYANPDSDCPLAGRLAGKLRASKRELVGHWLQRISERVNLDPNRVFPTEDLLDHVPLLIEGIADYLEDPAADVSTDAPLVAKAIELGALRHEQGFDAYEILKEYEILGGILFTYLARAADEIDEPCEKGDLLICGHRLFRAISLIQQSTTVHYLQLSEKKVAQREDHLRAFNRAISHEIKNDIGTIQGAAELLTTVPNLPEEKRDSFHRMILSHARAMRDTVNNLIAIARLTENVRQHRNVELPEAIREACRQVREAAQAANIDLRISPDIPRIEVNAAVVELCLTNYLSNAIKYSDPERTDSMVEIDALPSVERGEIVIRVSDNGIGVPLDKRARLFERFFRAHETISRAEGTGLGLSIVRDTVEAIGGRAWAESLDVGSVFCFSLPVRREMDARP